jgi:O-antigen ligase
MTKSPSTHVSPNTDIAPEGLQDRRSDEVLVWLLALNLGIATLTLWVQAYWPVALFEVGAFFLAATALLYKKRPAQDTYFPLLALAFIAAWGTVQFLTGWSVVRFETMNAVWKWTSWLAVYYVAASTIRNTSLSERLRLSISWFGFAVAAEAILQAFLSSDRIFGVFPAAYHDFVMGPILYHTHFAVFVETILPVSLSLAFSDAKRGYTFLGVSAVLIASVVVSASRGGLVITLLEVITVLVLLWVKGARKNPRIGLLALGLAGSVAVLILLVGFGTISERFHTGTFVPGRFQFAVSSLHMIRQRPWTGFGLGCWPAIYPAFALFDPGAYVNQAHSDWLQWTAEGGLPVGIAMLSLFIWALRRAVSSIWGIGVVAVLVHAAFDYPFSRPAVGAWPILILAMAAASETRHELRSNFEEC